MAAGVAGDVDRIGDGFMKRTLISSAAGVVLALGSLGSTGALAAPVELAGLAPSDTSVLDGLSVYPSGGGALSQAFNLSVDATLEAIVWWGYRLDPLASGAPDVFEIDIDGVVKTGSLSTATDGALVKYTLDIADETVTAGTAVLTLLNNNGDEFEWYWQCAASSACSGVAFSLIGTPAASPVPTPGTLPLLALAGLSLLAGRRRPA